MAESYKWLTLDKVVRRGSDGASIPNDPRNQDWQQFQLDGGVADAPDPAPTAAAITNDLRAGAITALLTDTSVNSKFIRAVLLVLLDEVNVIRTLPALAQSPRTVAQFKTAIQNKINAGAAD